MRTRWCTLQDAANDERIKDEKKATTSKADDDSDEDEDELGEHASMQAASAWSSRPCKQVRGDGGVVPLSPHAGCMWVNLLHAGVLGPVTLRPGPSSLCALAMCVCVPVAAWLCAAGVKRKLSKKQHKLLNRMKIADLKKVRVLPCLA